jgi:hypothetical protein
LHISWLATKQKSIINTPKVRNKESKHTTREKSLNNKITVQKIEKRSTSKLENK